MLVQTVWLNDDLCATPQVAHSVGAFGYNRTRNIPIGVCQTWIRLLEQLVYL